jgi:SOS-response transcriptional repressor LexA
MMDRDRVRHLALASGASRESSDLPGTDVGESPLRPLAQVALDGAPTAVREQCEWEKDVLVALAGWMESARADSVLCASPHFLDWLARDLSEQQRPGERWSEARIAALAERVQARVCAESLPVIRVAGAPELRAAAVTGSVAAVLDEAAVRRCAPLLDLAIAAGAGRELWDEECESWVSVPPEVGRGRYVALTVSGNSMTPLMHSGDVVLVKLGAAPVRDSVVVARRPDHGYVVKRVGRVQGSSVELLSLNPDFPPITVPRTEQSIVGTVVMRWCGHAAA